MAEIIPPTAPFSDEQRQWLNGFFAGLLALDNAGVTPLSPTENARVLEAEEEAPWHDPAMPIADRMKLAEGKPLKRQLFRCHGPAELRTVRLSLRNLFRCDCQW